MVAAGEASGNMALAFDRLARLTRQQTEIRTRILGALTYPAVLMCLCLAVMVTMFTFVLPRFSEMFEALDVQLPLTTRAMIASSRWAASHVPYVLLGLAAGVGGRCHVHGAGELHHLFAGDSHVAGGRDVI